MFPTNRIVDTLFYIGVFLNFLKAIDLVISDNQKKWVDGKFETLVLEVHYSAPLDWYAGPHGARKIFIFFSLLLVPAGSGICYYKYQDLICLIGLVLSSTTLILILARRTFRSDESVEEFINQPDADPFVIFNPSLNWSDQISSRLKVWMLDGKSWLDYLTRPLVIVGFGLLWIMIAAIYVLLGFGVSILLALPFPSPSSIQIIVFLIVFSLVLIGYVQISRMLVGPVINGFLAFLLLLSTLLFIVIELALKLIRRFMWMLARYNRGPVAAIVVVITIALGFLDLYLKRRLGR